MKEKEIKYLFSKFVFGYVQHSNAGLCMLAHGSKLFLV